MLSAIKTGLLQPDARPGQAASRAPVDLVLFWSVLLLLSIGFVMVYSASIMTAETMKATGYRGTYFMMRHAVYLFVGVTAAIVVFQIPMALWRVVSCWYSF
jgi:cell division protein FtsW